jgi:hypothetical protein
VLSTQDDSGSNVLIVISYAHDFDYGTMEVTLRAWVFVTGHAVVVHLTGCNLGSADFCEQCTLEILVAISVSKHNSNWFLWFVCASEDGDFSGRLLFVRVVLEDDIARAYVIEVYGDGAQLCVSIKGIFVDTGADDFEPLANPRLDVRAERMVEDFEAYDI